MDSYMKTKSLRSLFLVGGLLAALATGVLAHGGGLDSYGGHHDRKRGGYHFHRGPLAGQYFASQSAAIAATNASQTPPASSHQSLAPATDTATVEQRLEALTRLLVRKGVITKAELVEELQLAD